jgi:hypothetical protein
MEADTVLMKTKLVSICYALIADIAKSAGPVEKLSATPRPLRNSSKTVPKKHYRPGALKAAALACDSPAAQICTRQLQSSLQASGISMAQALPTLAIEYFSLAAL